MSTLLVKAYLASYSLPITALRFVHHPLGTQVRVELDKTRPRRNNN